MMRLLTNAGKGPSDLGLPQNSLIVSSLSSHRSIIFTAALGTAIASVFVHELVWSHARWRMRNIVAK
jgi:hypothetical protein